MPRTHIRPRYKDGISVLGILRRERGFTQERIAREVHVVPSTIVGYENGHNVLPDIAKRIADFLGVDFNELWVIAATEIRSEFRG